MIANTLNIIPIRPFRGLRSRYLPRLIRINPTWSVKADKAKLTNDRMLYLYGHVEVNALVPDSQLAESRRITRKSIW
ncbi:LPS export ABC transporter periplasmic protein LptC [Escherichia coli]